MSLSAAIWEVYLKQGQHPSISLRSYVALQCVVSESDPPSHPSTWHRECRTLSTIFTTMLMFPQMAAGNSTLVRGCCSLKPPTPQPSPGISGFNNGWIDFWNTSYSNIAAVIDLWYVEVPHLWMKIATLDIKARSRCDCYAYLPSFGWIHKLASNIPHASLSAAVRFVIIVCTGHNETKSKSEPHIKQRGGDTAYTLVYNGTVWIKYKTQTDPAYKA